MNLQKITLIAFISIWGFLSTSFGQITTPSVAPELAADPQIEAQMNRLAKELRCLVCQNESIESSRAGLADDLRRELRDQIKIGKSDDEIKNFMVERYGEFVLYRPRFKPSTLFLWLAPLLFTILAIGSLIFYIKNRNREIQAAKSINVNLYSDSSNDKSKAEKEKKLQALLKD